jgi:2,3-diketo-5-methylthio-1-phosphopentane phosphatase
MDWQILCDFDGTISSEDVTDSLLSKFADPQWRTIEAAWQEGRIGSQECMSRQIDLIRATPNALLDCLMGVQLDPEFAEFVEFCRANFIPLTVVSDGIDFAIRFLLMRKGLDALPVKSNHIEHIVPNRYRLTFPHADLDCRSSSGTCKCAVARSAARGRRTLLIGDGRSDFCAASAADMVFARGALLRYCIAEKLPHFACHDFREARHLLPMLVTGETNPVVSPEIICQTDTAQEEHVNDSY